MHEIVKVLYIHELSGTHTHLRTHIFALKHDQNAHLLSSLENIDWASLSGLLACTIINH